MDQMPGVIAAFSESDASRLTGVSVRQLRYWDRTGFFKPSLSGEDGATPTAACTFRDLACLQVLHALRNEAHVSLPHLRDVKETLAHLGDDMWAKTTLYVLNRRVVFYNPETDRNEEIISGQGVLQIPLAVVRAKMEDKVTAFWARKPADIGRIERRRNIAGNRNVIAGTRIPVAAI